MVKFLTKGEISKMDDEGKILVKFYFYDLQEKSFYVSFSKS